MKISLEKAGELLQKAGSIVITAHENPDGDAIGSTLALMYYLKVCGKQAVVCIDDDIPRGFNIVPGAAEIVRRPPEGFRADLLVVLDTGLDRIGRVREFCPEVPVLNLDHHISNTGGADYLYVDHTRAAVAELVYELLTLLGAGFTKEMAWAVYTGLATDTGFFKYSNTTPYTMRAAADMIAAGAVPNLISEALEAKPYEVIKGMAAAMQTIEITSGGRISGMYLDYETMQGIESTEGFIDYARVIEGVEVAVLIKSVERKVCRVSMRSKGFDVNKIAMSFGGGGHVRAAGCTIYAGLAEAKEKVLGALKTAMGEK